MIIKRVAERTGLNCGQCITRHGNKCAEGPHCQHFFLHKFRHTFATEHLRHGIDIRTLQSWMGHRDIKSTMVYLKGVQSKDALAKVNAGAIAQYVMSESKASGQSGAESLGKIPLVAQRSGVTVQDEESTISVNEKCNRSVSFFTASDLAWIRLPLTKDRSWH
jgi:integrase-like protein